MTDAEFLMLLREKLVVLGIDRHSGLFAKLDNMITRLQISLYPLMTPEEVAKFLGVTEKRLKNWRENSAGGPKWLKVGQNATRYRREDVEVWLLTRLRVPKFEAREGDTQDA